MSIKPKYTGTDSDDSELIQTTFFLWDDKEGQVVMAATQPDKDIAWPLQVLRVIGPSAVPEPISPMTTAEFGAWRQALDAAGFDIDVRSK